MSFGVPRACAARVKRVVVVVVIGTKHEKRQISRSTRDVKLQQIQRKTAFSTTLRIAEHGSQALQIVHFSFSRLMPVVYGPHPFCWPVSIVLMRSRSNIIGAGYVLLSSYYTFPVCQDIGINYC